MLRGISTMNLWAEDLPAATRSAKSPAHQAASYLGEDPGAAGGRWPHARPR